MISRRHFIALLAHLLSGCSLEPSDPDRDALAVGEGESALCGNALSPTEEKTALKLIDDICGDTWCEGDNDFGFDRLTCRGAPSGSPNGGSCTLRLRILPRDEGAISYARVCTTSGFSGFASLVETAPNGYQSLNWDYYLALTNCIERLEEALPR